ncbi:MAG: HEAT repeat domain-containing protein [Acidobacteria bacterium]|nr:HEAT repeat domain-containing protein [Acidobacteriota bacterium]
MKRVVEVLGWLTAVALFAFASHAVFAAAGVRAGAAAAQESRPAPSVESLLSVLRKGDRQAREQAVEELKRLGPAAAPALTEFLNVERKAGRAYAAEALLGIEPKNELALRVLTGVALKGDGDEVLEAAVALAEHDPDSAVAVPRLVKMASKFILIPTNTNVVRQREAAYALGMTTPGVRALGKLLGHWDPWVCETALFALDDLTETLDRAGPAKRAAVREMIPALVKLLSDKDKVVRGMAAEVLGQIGADAVPELKRAAADGDKKLAPAAAELLKRMGRS